jgi:hypothetical protein
MTDNGTNQRQGVPAWVGPLLIGIAGVAAASFFGAVQGAASQMNQHAVQIATIKTSFDGLCEKIVSFMARKDATDNRQDQVNERQDKELQQIRIHLRLPPP